MKKIIISGVLASSLLLTQAVAQENQEKKGLFVSVGMGYSYGDIEKKDDKTAVEFDNSSADENGRASSIALGYRYNSEVFTALEYSRACLDNALVQNLALEANYQFSNIALKPYIGASVGMSWFGWDEAAIAAPEEVVEDSSRKALYGLQVGVEQSLGKNIDFFAQTKLNFQKHHTYVSSPVHDTDISYGKQTNTVVGIRYYF